MTGQRRVGRIVRRVDPLQEKLGIELLTGSLIELDGVVYRVGGFLDHGDKVALWREPRAHAPNARKSPATLAYERAKREARIAVSRVEYAEEAGKPPEFIAPFHRAAAEALRKEASAIDALGATDLAEMTRETAEAHEQAASRVLGGSHAPNARAATIYEALWSKLGREPTNDELRAEVQRIKTEALVEAAGRGQLAHQRRRGMRRNTGDDAINIANPENAEEGTRLWRFWFGQIGSTIVYVWEDSEESAFEIAVEWLDDNDYAGHFTTITEADLKAAAEDEGIGWNPEWSDPRWADWDDPNFLKVVEAAEADLTLIGHTTLKHGTHLVSYEWGYDEVTDSKEYESVLSASQTAED